MSSQHVRGNEGSQAQDGKQVELDLDEHGHERDAVAVEFADAVITENNELQPSVEQEIQATVDTNHPDAQGTGLTLEAEERLEAREAEITRTRQRYDRRQESDRERRTRQVAAQGSLDRRLGFAKRAASVDRWADPELRDPREQLTCEQLGAVNHEAARLETKLSGLSRAAISRRLAERVVDGGDLASAVLTVFEELRLGAGQVIPIEAVRRVDRAEVSIEGRVSVLWEPSSKSIAQVGLLEGETGRIKFTVWQKSQQPVVCVGDWVRFEDVPKNWYQGRVSVALTGRSRVSFPASDRARSER